MMPLARIVLVHEIAPPPPIEDAHLAIESSPPTERDYRIDAHDADAALATALRFELPSFPGPRDTARECEVAAA